MHWYISIFPAIVSTRSLHRQPALAPLLWSHLTT